MSEFEEAFCNSTKKSMTFKNGTVLEEGNKFLMRQVLGDDADLDCKEGTVQVVFLMIIGLKPSMCHRYEIEQHFGYHNMGNIGYF